MSNKLNFGIGKQSFMVYVDGKLYEGSVTTVDSDPSSVPCGNCMSSEQCEPLIDICQLGIDWDYHSVVFECKRCDLNHMVCFDVEHNVNAYEDEL